LNWAYERQAYHRARRGWDRYSWAGPRLGLNCWTRDSCALYRAEAHRRRLTWRKFEPTHPEKGK